MVCSLFGVRNRFGALQMQVKPFIVPIRIQSFVFICDKCSQQHFRQENLVLSAQRCRRSSPSFITRNEVLMTLSARLEGSGIKCAPEVVGVPAYIMYSC